jgi:hypothetical protein
MLCTASNLILIDSFYVDISYNNFLSCCGNYIYQNVTSFFCPSPVSRHRTLMNIVDKAPHVHREAFVAPSASLIGDVQVGQGSSIWYGCVLRGLCLSSR